MASLITPNSAAERFVDGYIRQVLNESPSHYAKVVAGVIATTAVDLVGESYALSVLEGLVEKINGVGVDQEPRFSGGYRVSPPKTAPDQRFSARFLGVVTPLP